MASHIKPDKRYSMLPTVLEMCGDLEDKSVVDVGCGDGFFTQEFAKQARTVVGIDNSPEQIKRALLHTQPNIEFACIDMNEFEYLGADIVNAPYVINYLKTPEDLEKFFSKIHKGMNSQGKLIGIVDMPQSTHHDMRKFGSIKNMKKFVEGEKIDIQLFNEEHLIVKLQSIYHSKIILTKVLDKVGFTKIEWNQPIVSTEGLNVFGEEYWNEYLIKCDVAYFSATK